MSTDDSFERASNAARAAYNQALRAAMDKMDADNERANQAKRTTVSQANAAYERIEEASGRTVEHDYAVVYERFDQDLRKAGAIADQRRANAARQKALSDRAKGIEKARSKRATRISRAGKARNSAIASAEKSLKTALAANLRAYQTASRRAKAAYDRKVAPPRRRAA
jgi:hypothetical protein